MPDDSLSLLQQQYHDIWESEGWKDFRTFRADHWDPLIRRRAPQSLNPTAAQFLQSTNTNVDIQSPDLEKDLHDRVAYQLSNAVKIDAVSLDKSKTGKENVEDIRISSAASWLRQDSGHRISRHVFTSLNRYGVYCERKTWHMPEEPDDEEINSRVSEMKGSSKIAADKRLKAREDYFEDYFEENDCFDWQPISPLELAWFPLMEPEVFIQESVVPYVEARNLKDKLGKVLRLDKASRLVFWGESQPSGEVIQTQWNGKKIHLVVRAMLDKETKRWRVTEWVRESAQKVEDSQQLDEYVCPFGRAPYFVGSADEDVTETSPHFRYRPAIYPLICDVQELNALVTLLVQVSVWHLQHPFYVRLDGAKEELLNTMEGMQSAGMGLIEGTGAERKFVFRTPDPGSGEVMAAPRLEAMPNATLPEAFVYRIQQVQNNIVEHRSNRYLTGEAFAQTEKQPATSTLNQAEAAATPFGPYMEAHARFVKNWLVAEHEAISYWDEGSEKGMGKTYPVRTRGDEPVLSSPKEAGEVITLTAEKLKTPYFLNCVTKNSTQAEDAMNQQLADLAYEKGAITKEQWLRLRGADDPQKQIEDLWKEQQETMAEAHFQPVLDSSYARLFQALTGLNEELAGAMSGGQGQLPPAGGTSGGNGATQPMLAKPQMTPAPVSGATGATSPAGKGMA